MHWQTETCNLKTSWNSYLFHHSDWSLEHFTWQSLKEYSESEQLFPSSPKNESAQTLYNKVGQQDRPGANTLWQSSLDYFVLQLPEIGQH